MLFRSAEQAHGQAPDDRQITDELANRYGWKGAHLEGADHLREALPLRAREAELVDGLIALDPRNLEYRERRQYPEIGTALVLIKLKRPKEAFVLLKRSLAEYERLEQTMSPNGKVLGNHMRVAFLLAQAARDAKMPDAPQYMAAAEALLARLKQIESPQLVEAWTRELSEMKGGKR